MKKLTTVLAFFITISSFAQEIKVKDVKYKFLSGEKFALSVNIHSNDKKDIAKAFKKEAGEEVGIIVEKKGEIFIDNASIPSISEDKIDVYAAIDKRKDGITNLIVCFEISNNYILPKSAVYKNAEKFMAKLAKEISIIVIEKELKEEGKELKNIKEKIEKKKERNESLAKDAEKREKEIEDNKKELKDVSSELKGVVKDINNGKGKLDKLVKQKEKLDKKQEKLAKKISKDQDEVKGNHKKIEKNKKDIENLEGKKSKQEKVVDGVKKKLTKVK